MTLYINSTDFNKVTFAIGQMSSRGLKSGIQKKSYKIDPHESHETLAKLDDFLHSTKILNLKSLISSIVVNKGPGSYTGVRIGLAHAMALSLALNVPVKALSNEQFIKALK